MAYDYNRLLEAGISFEDAAALRRISMTLHRWHEMECGDSNDYVSWSIVRGENTKGGFLYDDDGKPYIESHPHTTNNTRYSLIPDRERGALKRLKAIMAKYPALSAYVQTDPRGCSLYIGEGLTDTNYNRGIAIYK